MNIFTFLNPMCVLVQWEMRLCQNWNHLSFYCSCNRFAGHSTQGVAILALGNLRMHQRFSFFFYFGVLVATYNDVIISSLM